MKEALGFAPEFEHLQAVNAANAAFTEQILAKYPPVDVTRRSNNSVDNGDYWGRAVATACAELGLPIGFGRDPQADSASDIQIFGSAETVNYWLHIAGFELRGRDLAANSESRSGIFTMLSNPVHGQLFEHVYSLYTGVPLEEIIVKDPMFEVIRHRQPATDFEVFDHEGIGRLYQENPEHCLRLYLTRQLPHLKYLRNSIDFNKRLISLDGLEPADDMSDDTKRVLANIAKERQEAAPFRQSRVDFWQAEYDFTMSLLMDGYKPYSLEEVVPHVYEYVIGLIAAYPELTPAHQTADIPDVYGEIRSLLTDLQKRADSE